MLSSGTYGVMGATWLASQARLAPTYHMHGQTNARIVKRTTSAAFWYIRSAGSHLAGEPDHSRPESLFCHEQ
jgi:hypothetical protein